MSAVAMAVILGAGTAAAKITRYECNFEGNWMPGFVLVEADLAKAEAKVFDGIIKEFVGTPIDAKIAETKARAEFSWDVRITSKTKQTTTMDYTLTYYKDGRKPKLTATPRGYDNRFTTEGTCKVGTK